MCNNLKINERFLNNIVRVSFSPNDYSFDHSFSFQRIVERRNSELEGN